MKRAIKFFSQPVAMLVVIALFAFPAFAINNASVVVTATPGAQTSDLAVNGSQVAVNMTYAYGPLTPGSSLSDHIPVRLCAAGVAGSLNNGDPISPYPDTVAFRPHGVGGNLPGVTYPADTVISADGCTDVSIAVNTGALAAGNYNLTIDIVITDSPNHTNASVDNVKNIHIHVNVADASNPISCFITDSDFVYLSNCAGTLVTSGSDGRFQIVTNSRKVEVSTNPGQFYYNVLWTNTTGGSQTVTVSMPRVGVNPHGTQAIHAMTFPSYPGVTAAEFEQVNDAIPGGHDDVIENVVVPAGWTVWVDYHLTWSGLGAQAPAGIATTCAGANQNFSVNATVTGSFGSASCGAGASGYAKK